MNKKLSLLLVLFTLGLQAQNIPLSLERAIDRAQELSPDYQINLTRYQSSYWRYRNYKAGLMPQMRLNATIPSYTNSSTLITNDQGEDIFVYQNQANSDLRLSVNQNIGFTGGILSVNSEIDRIDVFGDDKYTSYQVVPFSINYFQNSVFYNPYKWDREIEPLYLEESRRDFIEQMESISVRTNSLFFSLLKNQIQLRIAENNLQNQDTLLKISQGRYEMGKLAENELLQMELSLLNSQNEVTNLGIQVKQSKQNLARFLNIDEEDLTLETPTIQTFFDVPTQRAMDEANANRKSVIEFRRRRLEAEKELARVKGTNRLELNLQANFGLSQQGNQLSGIFQDMNQQQAVVLSVGIPLFDWGVSKSQRKMAQANLDLVTTNLQQDQQEFEQEITLHTMNWANQQNFLMVAEKAQEIALKRYEITKQRYIQGKISITDLNLAQSEKDRAVVSYLSALEKYYSDYYVLRRLTLYDFKNDKKIEPIDILF
ncbi:MAG: TolC family protein [Flavobacteriaceae bacterium]